MYNEKIDDVILSMNQLIIVTDKLLMRASPSNYRVEEEVLGKPTHLINCQQMQVNFARLFEFEM